VTRHRNGQPENRLLLVVEIFPFTRATQLLTYCLSETRALPTLFCLVPKVQKYWSYTSTRRPEQIVGWNVSS